MNRSDDLRKNAENCVALAEAADSDPKKKRYARMATAWNSLADTQAWLDGQTSGQRPSARCLGFRDPSGAAKRSDTRPRRASPGGT